MFNHRTPGRSALFAAALCLSLGATAQTASPATSGAANTASKAGQELDRSDRKFITDAAAGGMAEVTLGRLAQQRASDAQVKAFGERMASDHGKANDELMQLAAAKGVQLPAEPDRSHKMDADRLGKLSGPDFDRAYMKHMVDDHKKDVSEFKKASASAKDPQVKAFAAKTLPTLQAHLTQAESTYDAVRKQHASGPAPAASR